MRLRSSNLPKVGAPSVGVVLARQVVLEITHQVLQYIHMLAPGAHDAKAFHEHGPILCGEFIPVPLARIRDEAAPAPRRAISVVMA
jgi:hypothetical protein